MVDGLDEAHVECLTADCWRGPSWYGQTRIQAAADAWNRRVPASGGERAAALEGLLKACRRFEKEAGPFVDAISDALRAVDAAEVPCQPCVPEDSCVEVCMALAASPLIQPGPSQPGTNAAASPREGAARGEGERRDCGHVSSYRCNLWPGHAGLHSEILIDPAPPSAPAPPWVRERKESK